MRTELREAPGASFQMEEVEVEDHQDHLGLEEEVVVKPLHLVVEAEVVARPTLVEVGEGEEPPQDPEERVVGEVRAFQ